MAKTVTIRTESGDEVQGHSARWKFEDTHPTQDDTQGPREQVQRYRARGRVPRPTSSRPPVTGGEPVYVRFPDGAEVRGHRYRWGEDTTGEDVEGHRIVTPPQHDIP
jgi:hypothetical protein